MLQGYFAEFLQLYSSTTFIYSTYLLVSDLIRLVCYKLSVEFIVTKIVLGLGHTKELHAPLKRGRRLYIFRSFCGLVPQTSV